MRLSAAIALVLSIGMAHGAPNKQGDPGGEWFKLQLERIRLSMITFDSSHDHYGRARFSSFDMDDYWSYAN